VRSEPESLQQEPKSPDGATTGTGPVMAGTEVLATAPQPIAGTSTQIENAPHAASVAPGSFATFDPSRKHLLRVVADEGGKVTVRRFDKKTGAWRTKNEARERDACIPLTADEAEKSFPGCVAAWEQVTQLSAVAGDPEDANGLADWHDKLMESRLSDEAREMGANAKALVKASRSLPAKNVATGTYAALDGKSYDFSVEAIDYASMSTKEFHETLCSRVDEMQKGFMQTGLTLYQQILPGLEDARRRFAAGEKINGHKGIEAYIESLGLTPEQVRQWRHRALEKELIKKTGLLTGHAPKKRGKKNNKKEDAAPTVTTVTPTVEAVAVPEPGTWTYDKKKNLWANTDGRRIVKVEHKFDKLKDKNGYYVSDEYGNLGFTKELGEAKKIVRPVSTTDDLLKLADLMAVRIAGRETYSPEDMETAEEYLAARRLKSPQTDPDEDGRRKPQYEVTLTIEGSVLKKVEAEAKAVFGDKLKTVTKVEYGFTRADDLERAEGLRDKALEIVRELKGDLEQWKENLPENFQDGSKGEELDTAISDLEDIESNLDGVNFDVDFPGMY
jgi:hypothetical protein